MNKNMLKWALLALALIIVVGGSGSLAMASRSAGSQPSPTQVTESFYAWYLGYRGEPATRNALVDGAYRSSPFLAPAFVQKVDQIVASFDKGGYDPFLCAQDVPDEMVAQETLVNGDQASVVVKTSFPGHIFTVRLGRENGQWRITDVVCQAP